MKTTLLCACLVTANNAFALDFNAPIEKLAGEFKFTEGPLWVATEADPEVRPRSG